MNLKSTRLGRELSEVLRNPNSQGPETAYWVFSNLSDDKWENMTVLSPGTYDKEFVKTYGHYHDVQTPEAYKLVLGQGILSLQKKHYENGIWIPEIVDEVFLIGFCENEEVTIVPHEYGHSWSNTGRIPLITFDDWRGGHSPRDYEPMKKLKGLAYYILDDNGIKVVKNPNYKNHPEPKWVTPQEFNTLSR